MKKLIVLIIICLTAVSNAYANNCSSAHKEQYVCVIAGGTANMEKAQSLAHARSLALKTARILAYEKLAEKIKGVIIGSQNKMGSEMLTNQDINTIVNAKIRNVNFEKETISFLSDGSPWAEVTISIPKFGELGESRKVLEFNSSSSVELNESKTIVLDVRSHKFSPSLLSEIIAENGREVYSSKILSMSRLKNGGFPFRVYSNPNDIDINIKNKNTLIIKPIKVNDGQIIISNKDALDFIQEDLKNNVINNNNLVVLY